MEFGRESRGYKEPLQAAKVTMNQVAVSRKSSYSSSVLRPGQEVVLMKRTCLE